MGKLAEKYWLAIPEQFKYIELGDFVVMPNHIHGILIINKIFSVETQFIASCNINEERDAINCVSTKGGFAGSKNPLLNNNISRVIRWFKGRCSFEIRKCHSDFGWQTRFYDHIIRNEKSFKNIFSYIQNNPENFDGTTG